MEIDWVRMDGKKGTLVLTDEGIYFQPYDLSKKSPYLLGDAVSIGQTGVFGAFNLQKKLSTTKNLSDIAKDIREEKGIDQLVKANEATYISWPDINSIKKSWLSGNIVVHTKLGRKIKIRVSEIKKEKEITSFLSEKISSNQIEHV